MTPLDAGVHLRESEEGSTLTPGQPEKKDSARKWMWGALFAILAVQIYFVRALLAALFLFAVVFVAIAVVALGLLLVERAGELSLAWVTPGARRSLAYLAALSKRPFRRPHSETAR